MYDLNATDSEDINESAGNLTFSYVNVSGLDIFAGSFNTSTGVFNITFNDSHAGLYHLNVTVTDNDSSIDYQDFWVKVYSPPNLSSPAAATVFDLVEGTSSILNFTTNHTLQDNVTYAFYIDGITYNSSYNYGALALRESVNYFGNGSTIAWNFTPNLTDETYGLYSNLSVVVYPSASDLANASLVNTTVLYKLNITAANSPVSFDDNIDDSSTAVGSTVTINLSEHFSDLDYSDPAKTDPIDFTVVEINSSTTITSSDPDSNWILTFQTTAAGTGDFYVFASDGESNATSNNFTLTFTTVVTSSSSSSTSSGGGTTQVPVSLRLLMPDPTSAFQKDKIVVPITLQNDGGDTLSGISLNGSVAFNGTLRDDITVTFNESEFPVLYRNQKKEVLMTILTNTDQLGTFEITVGAKVIDPDYTDWGKMFLTVEEGESVIEKLLFVEEFLVENPECLELMELVDEAKELSSQGLSSEALAKADQAISACRDLISQPTNPRISQAVEDPLYRSLVIGTLVLFIGGISFYAFKRIQLRRRRGSYVAESLKSKRYVS